MHHSDSALPEDVRQEFCLGATGKFPMGQMTAEDEGEIVFAVGSDPDKHKVVLDFGSTRVAWIGMTPQQALQLSLLLQEHARRASGAVEIGAAAQSQVQGDSSGR